MPIAGILPMKSLGTTGTRILLIALRGSLHNADLIRPIAGIGPVKPPGYTGTRRVAVLSSKYMNIPSKCFEC